MGLSLGTDVRGAKLIGHGGAISGYTSDASWYLDAPLVGTYAGHCRSREMIAEITPGALPFAIPELPGL